MFFCQHLYGCYNINTIIMDNGVNTVLRLSVLVFCGKMSNMAMACLGVSLFKRHHCQAMALHFPIFPWKVLMSPPDKALQQHWSKGQLWEQCYQSPYWGPSTCQWFVHVFSPSVSWSRFLKAACTWDWKWKSSFESPRPPSVTIKFRIRQWTLLLVPLNMVQVSVWTCPLDHSVIHWNKE